VLTNTLFNLTIKIIFMKKKSILLSFLSFLLLFSSYSVAEPNKKLPKDNQPPWIVDVYYEDYDQLKKYAKNNAPWTVNKNKKYFTISVKSLHEYQELFSYGFAVEINQKLTKSQVQSKLMIDQAIKNKSLGSLKSIPDRACIRTVEETFSTMDALVTDNPTLASIVDIGDTWEKENPGGLVGYDLRVIKITNSAISGTKPKLFATSSIHARELAPAELSTRFAEYLLNNYTTDADARWIVDHREVHLLLQGNPDGRKVAESANTNKRKNENNNFCSGGNKGVDMNRNFFWEWGEGQCSNGCSSTNVCSDTYRGPSAQSESENDAIDVYLKMLFADMRGEDLDDAAPDNTTGVYLDIHSYSDLILFPYGMSDPGSVQLAPNHSQLQTLGRKFAWYNNYTPMPSNDLYGADGAAEDNAYGQLGVASYTFELGNTGFRPQCPYFEDTIVANNLKVLIYAAKVSDTPYITASGPDIDNLTLSTTDVAAGSIIDVSGIATDGHFYNDRTASPPVPPHVLEPPEAMQNISHVEMFIDQLPWDSGSTAQLLTASDGSFDTNNESFNGQINTTGLGVGEHVVYIQTTDQDGVTGVVYSQFFNIVDPALLGNLSGIIRDATTLAPIEASTITLDSLQTQSNSAGSYSFTVLAGDYDLTVNKSGYVSTSFNNLTINAQQNTNQNILLQPVCALLDDNIEAYNTIADAESNGWSHAAIQGSDDWSIDLTEGNIGPRAFKTYDAGETTDKWLISPSVALTADSSLEFWHKYNFEGSSPFYDGAILEISINAGNSWQILTSEITMGAYNATLASNNPLPNQAAWGGIQSNFGKVVVDLSSYAGNNAQLRWRLLADQNTAAGDWIIDDIQVLDPSACPLSNILFINGFE
jgi:hypothetical protein